MNLSERILKPTRDLREGLLDSKIPGERVVFKVVKYPGDPFGDRIGAIVIENGIEFRRKKFYTNQDFRVYPTTSINFDYLLVPNKSFLQFLQKQGDINI